MSNDDGVKCAAAQELAAVDGELGLLAELQSELRAEMTTLNAQLESPKPKLAIVSESVRVIRDILTGATGGLAAAVLAKWAGLVS